MTLDNSIVLIAPTSCCPYCSYAIKRGVNHDHKYVPKLGSWIVCINCAELLVFNEDLSLRKPTTQEMIEAKKSVALYNTQLAVRRIHATKAGKIIVGGGTA